MFVVPDTRHAFGTSSSSGRGSNSEEALRDHVRGLLLDYALAHIATDYIAFTEDASADVSLSLFDCTLILELCQLLSGILVQIPAFESTDLVLQPSLREAITSGLHLKDVAQFTERIPVHTDAFKYLSTFRQSSTRASPTMSCWNDHEKRGTPVPLVLYLKYLL